LSGFDKWGQYTIHRQFRKLTKTKGASPNESSLIKLLYLGISNPSKKMDYICKKLESYYFTVGYIF